MIYAVSDLHGCYDKYRKLLERLTSDDSLYILGDIVDRGSEGMKILLDLINRKKCFPVGEITITVRRFCWETMHFLMTAILLTDLKKHSDYGFLMEGVQHMRSF